jgi:hypothetical protein
MQILRTIIIVVFAGVALVLPVFLLRPLIRHEAIKNHWITYPSIIPTKNWKRFTSDEGKFSVWFPGTPEETNLFLDAPFGKVQEHIFYVNLNPENSYAVGYCNSPKFSEFSKSSESKEFLKKCQEVIAEQEGRRIVYQKEIMIKNYPARDFEYVEGGKGNYSARIRYILVGDRIYAVFVVFLTANPHKLDRATFFESFSLVN